MRNSTLALTAAKTVGALLATAGVLSLVFSPFVGKAVFSSLWGVEPLAYIGGGLLIAGLGMISLSFFVPDLLRRRRPPDAGEISRRWGQLTQQYFELFDHDLGRPLRRILGKEREVRLQLEAYWNAVDPAVRQLMDEIERQVPSFRLMLSNMQVLVELEAPQGAPPLQAVEPSEVVRKIADRYTPVATEAGKNVTWWAEPTEFGIVYTDSAALEHIVANLVDNAVRFAASQVEVKLTKNPTHFFVRVWDDGPGIPSQYLPHLFDRGWTPELARGEEKSSSGLGLFIARTLARRYGGDLTVDSDASSQTYTAFLMALPLGSSP